MIKGGKGGASTTVSGLKFEQRMSAKTAFEQLKGYEVRGNDVFFEGNKVAELMGKYRLYKIFLKRYGIDSKEILSKRLVPDEAIFVPSNNTLFIVEKKFQHGSGSVDEKLQTCNFKLQQYRKLLSKAKIRVEYIYVLSKWFDQPCYKDVIEYIDNTCFHYFEELPLTRLGLPLPKD